MNPKRKSAPSTRKRRQGMTLIELVVCCALITSLGIVLVILYKAATSEFEHASGTITLSEHARMLSDKLVPVLTTAAAGRANGDAFYHPDQVTQLSQEMYEVDFITTFCFMPTQSEISDTLYVPNPITATLPADGQGSARQPNYFRYRVAWTKNAITRGTTPLPARCVYMERLLLNSDNGNTADSGSPYTGMSPRILMRDIAYCGFNRSAGSSVQLHMKLYNIDPENGHVMDGELMRSMTNQSRTRSFELYSTLQLPALTMNPAGG